MNESTILEALKYFWALMDFGVIGIVLLSGYFAGRYLNQPAITKHVGTAWRTLIVSAVFVAIYVALLKKDGGTFVYTKLFVSYVTATSLYELIVKAIANYLPSQFNLNNNNTVNKTVFWGIPSSSYGQLVTYIDGVAVQGQVTVQNLPNYDSSFSFVQEYNSTNMVLTRNGLTIAQLTLNNGQSGYNVNSVICEWNGTRPIRPPR